MNSNDLVIKSGLINCFTLLLLFLLYFIIAFFIVPIPATFAAKILHLFELLLACQLVKMPELLVDQRFSRSSNSRIKGINSSFTIESYWKSHK